MVSTVKSLGIWGIDGYIIDVECSVMPGMPSFDIVGLPDTAVKESKERVVSAIKYMGFDFPLGKVTINLAPGNIKKEGSGFDLPIALSILIASERIKVQNISNTVFVGELSLKGELRPVNGVLPMVIGARKGGFENVVLPVKNAKEACVVKDMNIFEAPSFYDVIAHISGQNPLNKVAATDDIFSTDNIYSCDFADVKGQQTVKRGLEIAAAGGHNCLMIGTPGSGKSMLASRLPTILPDLTFEEALEVTKIHSIAGLLNEEQSFINTRPFRTPHHSTSTISLAGGGRVPKPGEVSLAHNGVLFLDEFPEFNKSALEILRQPIEDRNVTISRVNATITYPSDFMLIAAMNPCPCGYFGDKKHHCTCTTAQIHKYTSKISGPILDRIDLHIFVEPVEYSQLTSNEKSESSAEIKKRVNKARKIQVERYKELGIYSNASLDSQDLNTYCKLDETAKKILESAFTKLGLSARAYTRIVKVARTIADLAGEENISFEHVSEAIQFRTLDRQIFG